MCRIVTVGQLIMLIENVSDNSISQPTLGIQKCLHASLEANWFILRVQADTVSKMEVI
jgi:hypothetical protein